MVKKGAVEKFTVLFKRGSGEGHGRVNKTSRKCVASKEFPYYGKR